MPKSVIWTWIASALYFAAGEGHKLAIEEYAEAINRFMVTAVPTVFFGQARVVGAVPLQDYLQVLEKYGVRQVAGGRREGGQPLERAYIWR